MILIRFVKEEQGNRVIGIVYDAENVMTAINHDSDILVESIPEPEAIEGKSHVMYANTEDNTVFYKYVDVVEPPVKQLSPMELMQKQIDELKATVEALQK